MNLRTVAKSWIIALALGQSVYGQQVDTSAELSVTLQLSDNTYENRKKLTTVYTPEELEDKATWDDILEIFDIAAYEIITKGTNNPLRFPKKNLKNSIYKVYMLSLITDDFIMLFKKKRNTHLLWKYDPSQDHSFIYKKALGNPSQQNNANK